MTLSIALSEPAFEQESAGFYHVTKIKTCGGGPFPQPYIFPDAGIEKMHLRSKMVFVLPAAVHNHTHRDPK